MESNTFLNVDEGFDDNDMGRVFTHLKAKAHARDEYRRHLIYEEYKKELTNKTNQLNINILNTIENNKDDEMETLLKHNEQPIDVNYLTNYNERLLDGTLKNLREINSNLKETSIGLKNQGEQLKY